MEKLLFIYNPQAGKGQVRGRVASFLDIFTKDDWLVTVYPTQGPGDARRITAKLGNKFDRIICCGGDGTLHETVNGLMKLERRPELGYIPAGTTNDFARNLKLPTGYERRAAVAAAGVARTCDIGLFNGEHFVYVAAFGAFTDVAYDTPQQNKNMFGHFAYLLEGMMRLGSIQSYNLTVEHDGGVEEGEYIFGMVSNTISVGGLIGLPAKEVALDDGLLEVILIRKPKSAMELQGVMAALMKQKTDPACGVTGFHAAHLNVKCDRALPWTLDGEYGGNPEITEISTCEKAISIVYGE